jgi:hypothetical protein
VACRQQILDKINDGVLLTSYIGHATKDYWARERLLDKTGIGSLINGDKLTIALPMTCLDGYFHEAQVGSEAIAETNVRKAGGGAVASWSATGLGLAYGHDYLEQGLFLALFQSGVTRLGSAATAGKLYLLLNDPTGVFDDLIDTYLLLGDPALQVYLSAP